MKTISHDDFEAMESRYRANLINTCTGYKSSNLIATRSGDGIENVAPFSSVTHLGSHPPLLGFILRPTTVQRNTWDNIRKTGFFTVNHIHAGIVREAHQCSAKYPSEQSEFEQTGLQAEYHGDFYAPFVKGSPVQLGCRFLRAYEIEENGCQHVLGAIEQMQLQDGLLGEDGWLNLGAGKTITATGLDGYALPELLDRLSYAKPDVKLSSVPIK